MDKIKSILLLGIIVVLMGLFFPSCSAKSDTLKQTPPTEVYQQNVEVKKTSAEIRAELGIPMQKVTTHSKTKLEKLMKKCKRQKAKLKKSMPDESSVNYDKYKRIIDKELINIINLYKEYKHEYKQAVRLEKAAEQYSTATKIWRYLKYTCEYNDYVCAGIMGNIMAECGGQTLAIQATLRDGGYYGICQWSRAYSGVWGTDLNTQLNYLKNTIKYELDTYGNRYYRGFNYKAFLKLQNEQSTAIAFAKCYERCASRYYTVRQTNATKAYNYFVVT